MSPESNAGVQSLETAEVDPWKAKKGARVPEDPKLLSSTAGMMRLTPRLLDRLAAGHINVSKHRDIPIPKGSV